MYYSEYTHRTVLSYRTVQLTDSTVPKRKALFRAQSDDVALILLVRMDLTSPPIVDGHRSASLHGFVELNEALPTLLSVEITSHGPI